MRASSKPKKLGFKVDAKTYAQSLIYTVDLGKNVLKDLETLQGSIEAKSVELVVGKQPRDRPAPQ